ncbi:MAG: hypothetical protein QOG72_2473 [Sphingomonadales bacterium]|jgi:hypothetical protein|nr:hypothetical protein [Sphingomonadales bacterium]
MRLLPLLLLSTACVATRAGPSGGEAEPQLELAGRIAGAERDCVAMSSGANLVPRGRRTLVYRDGDTIWVNRLAASCPGLDEMSQILIEVHASQYCRGDHFQALDSGQSVPGPVCVLGSFTPYRR